MHAQFRSRRYLPLLAGAAALLLATATAGPVGADPSAYQPLLDRAVRTLQEAEGLFFAGREADARPHAQRALVILAEAARLRPQAPDPAYLAVHAAVFAGDRRGAATWLKELDRRLGSGSGDPRIHVAYGMVLLYLERAPDAAVEALQKAARLSPRAPNPARDLLLYAALLASGDQNVRSGAHEKALERYRAAVQLATRMGSERKRTAARGNAGLTLLAMSRFEDAEVVFRTLAGEDPKNPLWPLFRGRGLHGLGRAADAAGAWSRAADLADTAPTPAPAAYQRELKEIRFEAAILCLQLFERAAQAEERDARLRQARVLLARYVAGAPDSHRGNFVLGRVLYDHFEEPYAAMRYLEQAHRIDPVCDASIRLLIRIASRVGPPPPAEGTAPADPEAVAAATLAWTAKRRAWEAELEANTDAWEAERKKRRERSRDGSDGCPTLD